MTDPVFDIVIVGAGAAGLTSAIFAGEALRQRGASGRVGVVDGAKTVGAKILVAGGGRCNVTHAVVRTNDYNGPKNVVKNVLASFDEKRCVEWFASMDVQLKTEPTGKLFPVTDKARTVLDALLNRCAQLGIPILTDHRVQRLTAPDETGHFTLTTSQGPIRASCVVMATGGKSLPRTGSDGAGWEMLRELGHTVTPTHAALVSLVCDASFFHAQMTGQAFEVELRTFVEGKLTDARTGSLLWTHFGLSGPVVMDASRHFTVARDHGRAVRMVCNMIPAMTTQTLDAWLLSRGSARPRANLSTVLAELLPVKLLDVMLGWAGLDGSVTLSHLNKETRRAVVGLLTELPLPVTQFRGWNHAEVTAGGVPMTEVETKTMQSRVVPGLYLVGELLDVDGRIGGFNFQWAWATGYLAGKAVAG